MKQKFSLLVVDDNVELALNLRDVLEAEGYTAAVAHEAQTALKLCGERVVDLAIVDIKLPDKPGMVLVQEASQACPWMEYIIITGYASLDTAIRAVAQRGVVAYETKPLDVNRLATLVRQVAERRKAEASLRESQAKLQLLLERMPCVLWTTDAELRFTSSRGAGLAAQNLLSDQVVGMAVMKYARTDDPEHPVVQAHRRALEGTPSSYETTIGERIFYAHVEPLRDAQGGVIGVIGASFDITERKRMEEELRNLSRRLVEVQENERREIARELHDQVGQSLTVLKLFLDRARRASDAATAALLQEAQSVVRELMGQVREMSLELRPKMLDDLGLLPTFLWYFERFTSHTQVKVDFKHTGMERDFPQEVATAAFRIVQEAMSNVVRHAEVSEATVHAWVDNNTLSLRISDQGKGFSLQGLSADCSGLSGMRERATNLGGKCTVQSVPGGGTAVVVELPLSS